MDPKDLINGGFFDTVDLHREAPDAAPEAAGERFGRYVLIEELGQGGSSTVFRAQDVLLNRDVALKRLKFESGPIVSRFLGEAELLAKLSHPGIVPLYDLGRVGDTVYFTMPLIEGGTLQQVISSKRPGPREAARIVRDAAEAVQYAHDSGIIHRDLKPSNLMIDGHGRVMVADFGLGRREEEDGAVRERRTATGAFMGTLQYMSPEQARGDWGRVGPRSDVYSLGATLYEALTGRAPLNGDSALEILRKISQDEPAPPGRIQAGVPWELEVVCLHALEKEPERRYSSMKAFAEDLDRFLRGEPVHAKRASVTYRFRKKLHRHRVPVTIALVAMAVVAALSLVLIPGWIRARRQVGEIAARIRGLVEPLVDRYELAQLGPPADLGDRKRELREAEGELAAMLKDLPDAPEIYVQMARIRRCLRDPEKALQRVNEGFSRLGGRADAIDHLERAFIHLARWEGRMSGAEGLTEEDRRELVASCQPILDSARVDLEEAVRRGLSSRKAGWGRYYEALLEFARGNRAKSREQAGALAADTSVDSLIRGESCKLTARAWLQEGRYAESARDYAEAYAVKRCDPEAYAGAATARAYLLRFGSSPDPSQAEDARREADTAILIDPEIDASWNVKALLNVTIGQQRAARGEDSDADFRTALDCADLSLRIRPDQTATLNLRGIIHLERSKREARRGTDPVPELDLAIADFSRCVELYPSHANARGNRGFARTDRVRYRSPPEAEALAELDAAIEDCTRALELRPGRPLFLNSRGLCHLEKARRMSASPDEAVRVLRGSFADFRDALTASPQDSKIHNNDGAAHLLAAKIARAQGKEAEGELALAMKSCSRSIDLDPGYGDALTNRGLIRIERVFGGSPDRKEAQEGIRDFTAALKSNPANALALGGRGLFRGLLADYAGAAADLEAAFKINPGLGEIYRKALTMAREKAGGH